MKDDYYKILDVKFSASQEEIETNYRKLALKYHPDKSGDGSSDENMKLLNIAHQILRDPETRKEYDLNNGINQTLEKATTVEQVSTLTKEKHDIYLEVLKELLPYKRIIYKLCEYKDIIIDSPSYGPSALFYSEGMKDEKLTKLLHSKGAKKITNNLNDTKIKSLTENDIKSINNFKTQVIVGAIFGITAFAVVDNFFKL